MTAQGFLELAIHLSFALILAGLAGALVRLVRGPDMADRVVALDLIAIIAVAFMATWTLAGADHVVIDVAITLALVAFLATVAFARYIDIRRRLRATYPDSAEEEV